MMSSTLVKVRGARAVLNGVSRNVKMPVAAFSSVKSWVPRNEEKLQEMTIKSLIHQVTEEQRALSAQVVPWFLRKMPASYFRQVPEHFRLQHIKAVSVLQDLMSSELSLKINNKEGDFIYTTYINSQAKAGLLLNQIKNLTVPEDHTLYNVNVFSSLDGILALNVFTFAKNGAATKHATMEDGERVMKYIQELKAGKHANDTRAPQYSDAMFSEKAMEEYFTRVSPHYVQNGDPRRFCIQKSLYDKVHGHDGAAVHIEATHSHGTENTNGMSWVTVAAANTLPEVMLRLCAGVITARGLDVSRAHLDLVAAPGDSESVLMLRLLVSPVAGQKDLTNDPEFIETLRRDLSKIKWLDNSTTELGLYRHPSLGLDKAEVITAYCSMLHGPLCKIDAHNFASINSIIQLVSGNDKYVDIADSIATLFLDRFNPRRPLPAADFESRSAEIKKRIGVLQFEAVQVVLKKMLEGVNATLRTNFFHPDRYALSMRVNPAIMLPEGSNKPVPFGVIFAHGRHFNAFHNRFRDIARGGLRIVTPHNSDQFALESSRQYDEVYNLSYAQQLKNKDIPEGGSKAVVLVNTPAIPTATRSFALRKSVKAFVDSLLDLTVTDSVKNLVDFYGKEELIYLGPDEQVIPADIEWIIQRAAERGYPIPDAFMSSKASNGFNHKEFGVTSEGVVVYLDVALRRVLNIDPKKQPFTVKITGGPDGDVAGNLMNILYREYGDNCKIVAVADGFGCAEDPQGLDRDELLRLFHEALPISHFSTAKLSKEGVCLPTTSEEGLKLRNTMHFRVKTDVFVPAGGRPNTINVDNWHNFLDETGKPSSPLIVEGANIFTTPEARQNLFKKGGVTIVKDSSANKCGVITSSCEVAASMLLSKQEFIDIKPALVKDVLEKLRFLAREEGELLFREYHNNPGSLPHFSERISNAINKVTDSVTDALANVQLSDPLFQELYPLILENLPLKLAEVAGERVPTRFPVQYMRNAIASTLASKIVYKEGIHFVETQPDEKLAERAFQYYREETKVKKLVQDLEKLKFPKGAENEKEIVVDILKRGGARTALNIF